MSNGVTCLMRDYSSAATVSPIVRMATAKVDALYALATTGGTGLTSVQADRDVLASKLNASELAVADAALREAGAILDRTGAIFGNQVIADLGPRYPLCVSLLLEGARAALGCRHDEGRFAYQMLLGEGFRAGDYVDILDGGPTLVADIDGVRTVRDCCSAQVAGTAEDGTPSVVSAGEDADFRVARGCVGTGGVVASDLADTSKVGLGDIIRHVRI